MKGPVRRSGALRRVTSGRSRRSFEVWLGREVLRGAKAVRLSAGNWEVITRAKPIEVRQSNLLSPDL